MFWPVIWTDMGSFTGGTCDQFHRRLYLNKRAYEYLGVANVLQSAAHEYRHAWQGTQKVAKRLFERLGDQIVHNRKIEGDAVAFQLTVAWELRELGHPEIWNDSLEFMLAEYPECIKAFMGAIESAPRSLWNGQAQNAALLAWQHNRQRSAHYGSSMSKYFARFSRISPRGKSFAQTLVVRNDEIDGRLFKMPYAILQDGKCVGVRHRAQYGKHTVVEQSRLNRVTLAKSLHQCRRSAGRVNAP